MEGKAINSSVDDAVLNVAGLRVVFQTRVGVVNAVDGVSLDVPRGKTVCVVGESGSGKSTVAHAILRLVPNPGRIVGGRIVFREADGTAREITEMGEESEAIRRIRGNRIAMIFQEPMTSFSPVNTVGSQILEGVHLHRRLSKREAREEVLRMMRRVGIDRVEERYRQFPHELSGGLRQRAMIAMALVCQPALLIADEPTSALDVTVQAQILDLLRDLQREFGMAILFITHDFGVVAEMADEVVVMDRGRIVEDGGAERIFAEPRHDVTRRLLAAVPGSRTARSSDAGDGAVEPLLRVRGLMKAYRIKRGVFGRVSGTIRAVDDVSFDIYEGECFGLVGESGSGKTTVARAILRAMPVGGGSVEFRIGSDFVDLLKAGRRELRGLRRQMQMVFQDPDSSLNPRMTVGDIVGEPLLLNGVRDRREREKRVRELLVQVGLELTHIGRYPRAFSGGQRQRIGIARALALKPRLVVADEPVSALDVSVQTQVLDLMHELQREHSLTYLFIAHDLGLVRRICDRVAVMYRGRIVELAPTVELFERPLHAYTRALLAATPTRDPGRRRARADAEQEAMPELVEDAPLTEVSPGHFVRLEQGRCSTGNS